MSISLSPATMTIVATIFSLLILFVSGDCNCNCTSPDEMGARPNKYLVKYKIGAFAAILAASAIGVSLPILGKTLPALRPESSMFFLIKAFAAGVILSTGFIHILPDGFEDLTDCCLNKPWSKFPFAGLAAMVGAIGTLLMDAFATGYYSRRAHFDNDGATGGGGDHVLHGHGDVHGHGHGHIVVTDISSKGLIDLNRIRYRVTSEVLELGIIVHSVIIGLALGTSQELKRIQALAIALSFHQCFEGMGLGGCIAQADFKAVSTWCMGLFFSLTTPMGIAIGLIIMKGYKESSPVALIVRGLLNSCAAGILIYMALVDLLAQDFMSPKLQANKRLFLGSNIALLLGAGLMAALAYWA